MLGCLIFFGIEGWPFIKNYFASTSYLFPQKSSNPYLVLPDKGPDLGQLPDLSKIPWPRLRRPNTSDPSATSKAKVFEVVMSDGHRKTIEKLLDAFQEAMIKEKLNDQWFLLAGTLIGSVRHHDVVPWDEDVDIGIHVKYRKQVTEAMKRLAPDIEFYKYYDRDKINFKPLNTSTNTSADLIGCFKIRGTRWSWPFIDIWYHKNTTPGMASATEYTSYIFRLDDVYPVTYRPLGNRWYPAPRRPVNFLMSYYQSNPSVCDTGTYLHPLEQFKAHAVKDCFDLLSMYAFVQRCPLGFLQPRTHFDVITSLSRMVFANEHLVGEDGQIVHTLRTVISLGEAAASGFTVKPLKFNCSVLT